MSQDSKPKVTQSSSCLCKKVELAITGVDKGAVICHCSNCQQGSGSAFAYNHRLLESQLQVVKGENLLKQYADSDTRSGNTLQRHFCGNCGSPLYLTNPTVKGLIVLNKGNVQGDHSPPKFDLFPENKCAWVGDLTGKAKL